MHGHDHGQRASARHVRPLTAAFALVAGFAVLQVVVSLATDSLALLSDAGHMLTDALGIGMALAAIHVASRASRRTQQTFGLYRLEILAALANAVLLVGLAVYVLVEAAMRWRDPPEVTPLPVLVVGVVGLLVNVAGFRLLQEGANESLNVRGAYLEVLADLLGSVAVILTAVVIGLTGWQWVDPLVGGAIGLFVLPRALRLGIDAGRVLLQAAPRHIDVEAVQRDLESIPGVVDVHDLHVWTLTSAMDVASVHLMVRDGADSHGVLDQAREVLGTRYRLAHATLQVEPQDHRGCDELSW